MRYSLALVAAVVTAVSAQSACDQIYNQCFGSGIPEEICRCDLQACLGQDNARGREYCASVTATLTRAAGNPNPSAPITGTIVQPSGVPQVTARPGTIPLGGRCGADEQCASGAQCFGSTAGTIRACGNFNAECTSDSQCAFNTCVILPGASSGLCNGIDPSGSFPPFSSPASTAPAGPSATYACNPAHAYADGATCTPVTQTTVSASSRASAVNPSVGGPAATYVPGGSVPQVPHHNGTTGVATGAGPSGTSPVIYTGAANVVGTLSGFGVMVVGVVAWVL